MRETVARYGLIVKKLRRAPANWQEIADHLKRESELHGYNYAISKASFARDLEDIRAIYHLDIKYSFKKRVYEIADDEVPGTNERLLEAFDIQNALNLGKDLGRYMHFDSRKPHGTEYLYDLLPATKNRVLVSFFYQKFADMEGSKRLVEPYALKEFRNRWYLVAKDRKDEKIKTFGLDRMSEPEISNLHFKAPADFSVEDFFRYSFGIFTTGDKPEDVILSFEPLTGYYVKTLPLHEKFDVLADDKKEYRIKVHLYITPDLVMELLSYGEGLTVMAPQSLRERIYTTTKAVARKYE